MGCIRQYIYKLVANGKLKALRLSNRMAFLYTSAKRNQIPMCRIAGKNYYS